MSGLTIPLNITGNAERQLKSVENQAKRTSKAATTTTAGGGAGAVSGGAGGFSGINYSAIQEMIKSRKEADLLKRKENLQRKEEGQFRREQLSERTEMAQTGRGMMGMAGTLGALPTMGPIGMLQTVGAKMQQRAVMMQARRSAQIQQVMQERGVSAIEAAGLVKGGGAVKAAAAMGPVGVGMAIGAAGVAGITKISDIKKQLKQQYGVGALRGGASYKQMMDYALRTTGDQWRSLTNEEMMNLPRNLLLSGREATRSGSIYKAGPGGTTAMERLGRGAAAFQVAGQTTSDLQNVMFQANMAGFNRTGGRNYYDRVVTAMGVRQHSQNMNMFKQQVTQAMGAQVGVLGKGGVGTAEFIGSLSPAMMPRGAAIAGRMNAAMRGAAGSGTEREMFYLRAFGGDYQKAYMAMEQGLDTPGSFQKINAQLESEGYRKGTFGYNMRMKNLGLAQTVTEANQVIAGRKPTGGASKANLDQVDRSIKNYQQNKIAQMGSLTDTMAVQTLKVKALDIDKIKGDINKFTEIDLEKLENVKNKAIDSLNSNVEKLTSTLTDLLPQALRPKVVNIDPKTGQENDTDSR